MLSAEPNAQRRAVGLVSNPNKDGERVAPHAGARQCIRSPRRSGCRQAASDGCNAIGVLPQLAGVKQLLLRQIERFERADDIEQLNTGKGCEDQRRYE